MSCRFLADFSLAKLVDPTPVDTFLADYWEKKPLLIRRGNRNYYGDLLTLADFDAVIALNPNSLKVANNTDEKKKYVRGNVNENPENALAEMREGSTLILDSLHKRLPNLRRLVRMMEREFTQRFQTNIYLTPPEAKGFDIHVDKHDVFVMQVLGSKQWRLEKHRRYIPRGSEDSDESERQYEGEVEEFPLEAGDVLYIPRGHAHDATSTNESSMHITLGALPLTWEDVLKALVKQAADTDQELRKALPPGYVMDDPAKLVNPLRKMLSAMADDDNLAAVATQFANEAVTRFTADLDSQVTAFYGSFDLAPETRLGARPGMVYRVIPTDEAVVVLYGGRTIAFLDFLEEAIRFALDTPDFAVRDLPGDLEDEEKVVVAERLLQEGLVEVKRPGA
jgi:ribosomal protein L16 Arg81 hydroxylase